MRTVENVARQIAILLGIDPAEAHHTVVRIARDLGYEDPVAEVHHWDAQFIAERALVE